MGFKEALSGPVSEMKLHVIKGRSFNLQEAMAHVMEADVIIEADNRKSSPGRGDVRVMGLWKMTLQRGSRSWVKTWKPPRKKKLKEA